MLPWAPGRHRVHPTSLQECPAGWFSKSDDNFFLVTVVPEGQGARVDKFLGIVNGEAIIGAAV